MKKGLTCVVRLLLASLLTTSFEAMSRSDEKGAEVDPVNRGTAHEALYGLCLSGDRAIAVGQAGLILESGDRGNTWVELDRFTESAVLDVDCGLDIELYVGQGGSVYRRSGVDVEEVQSGTDARLMSVARSPNGELAVAAGAFGTILRSGDKGLTWQASSLDWFAILNDYVEPHLYDVHVSDAGRITIVGEFSLVLQSDDGGLTWQKRNLGDPSLFGLYMGPSGSGYAVGQEGTVLTTLNGGETWAAVATPTKDILLNITRTDSGVVLATGIRNFIFSKDQGTSWSELENPALTAGWYQGLALLPQATGSPQELLLTGHQATILKIELQ